ncbi:prepilin peptidase [Gordonia sp. CPCC 205515]|uniref:prepilin peptidase n=1 Tax=Gordonia sp. CPCC 205515 TaxID=3140791 RepID=UPI003AF38C11
MSLWIVLVWLSRITVGDLHTRRIPTPLLWPGIVATLAMTPIHPAIGLAALTAALPYLAAAFAGLGGGGDVKLAFVLGGLLGDAATGLVMVLLAAVFGVLAHAALRRRGPLPHAPALVAATVCLLPLGAWNN